MCKTLLEGMGLVVHTFIPSIPEAEAGTCHCLGLAKTTQRDPKIDRS